MGPGPEQGQGGGGRTQGSLLPLSLLTPPLGLLPNRKHCFQEALPNSHSPSCIGKGPSPSTSLAGSLSWSCTPPPHPGSPPTSMVSTALAQGGAQDWRQFLRSKFRTDHLQRTSDFSKSLLIPSTCSSGSEGLRNGLAEDGAPTLTPT